MHRTQMLTSVLCILLTAQSLSAGGDWPRFLGPAGDARSADTVPASWSEDSNLKFAIDLPGAGSSSPIVVNGRVYLTCFTSPQDGLEAMKRSLVCLDAESGKQIWKLEVPTRLPEDAFQGFITEHGYASSTPVCDGTHVFAFFGKSGVIAADMEGNLLWQKYVGQESSNRRWGSAGSLVLAGDALIVNASEESQSLMALNPKDGEELWKAQYDGLDLAYGTPIVREEDEKTAVVFAMPGEVWCLNAANGKMIWYTETRASGNVSPSVVDGGDVLYTFGGYPQQATTAIRTGGEGDVTDSHIVWSSRDSSYVATPLLHDGRLYWVNDRGQGYVADAASGETVHRFRVPGVQGGGRPFYASPVLVGDKIVVVSRRSGTYVFDTSEKMELLHQNPALDDTDHNATPAVSNGCLYIRSDKRLYCISH